MTHLRVEPDTVIVPDNRPSDYTYAVLSQHVYGLIKLEDILTIGSEEWKVVSTQTGHNGYFGAIYANEQNKQLVIVHRGTQSFGSIIEDIESVILKRITAQHQAAYSFTKKAVEQAKDQGFHLSSTGHSLGALLAELSTYWCHDQFEYCDINAVTFESPGSRDLIEKRMLPNILGNRIDLDDIDIIQYLSYPNLINTYGRHIGTVYQLYPMLGNLGWIQGWYTYQAYTMANIIKIFEEDGYDDQGSLKTKILMQNWPLGSERRKYFSESLFLEGKYALKELTTNVEFLRYYKENYVPAVEMDIEKQLLLRHFRQEIKQFLLDFFQFHKHLLTDRKTKQALITYWQNNGISSQLVELLLDYEIDDYGNVQRVTVFSTQNILSWRYELSVQLSQHVRLIPSLFQPLKYEHTVQGLVIIEDRASLDRSMLSTKRYSGEIHRKYKGTPEAILRMQKEGFNPNKWYLDGSSSEHNANHLTLSNDVKITDSQMSIEDHNRNLHEEYEFIEDSANVTSQLDLKTRDNSDTIKRYLEKWKWIGFLIFLIGIGSISVVQYTNQMVIRSDLNVPAILLDRPELIKKIKKGLAQNKGISTVAIVGVVAQGGAGKTTLSRYYGRYVSKAHVVWELNAERRESLINSFRDLAHALAKTPRQKQELECIRVITDKEEQEKQLLSLVKMWLKEEKSWLLIYDNVEDFKEILKYFPQDLEVWGNGNVIITTRNANIQNSEYFTQGNVIQIEELTDNEKLILFSKIFYNRLPSTLKSDQRLRSTNFLKNIPSSPLDVLVAVRYLKLTDTSFDKYLEHLKKYEIEFENTQAEMLRSVGPYTKTRYGIITTSLKQLIETDPDFIELVLFISLLDSQNIPKDLLDTYKKDTVIGKFIAHLKKHSFITNESLSILGPTFSIHRSTQEIIRVYLTRKLNLIRNKEYLINIASSLECYMNKLLDEEACDKFGFLLNHCETFLSRDILTDEIMGPIGAVLGGMYCELERHDLNTKKLLEKSLKYLEKYDSKNTDKIALTLSYLGYITYSNDIHKGKDLFEQSMEVYRKNQLNQLGAARVMTYLGDIYRILGDYEKARNLLEKSIEIYQKCRKSHNGIGRATRFLGVIYRELGNYKKARNLLEQSIIIYKKTSEVINIAISMTYLGSVCRELGDYEQAKILLEKSLTIYKNHRFEKSNLHNIYWTQSHLAIVHNMLGNYAKAKNLLEQVLKIQNSQDYWQKDSPNIVWTLLNLGNIYRELGDYEQAKILLEKSLAIHTKYYPAEHIDIGQNFLYLGRLYNNRKEYKKAKDILKQSLVIYKKHYGDDHIQTAKVLNVLGENYLSEDDLKTAESLFNRALGIFKIASHPEIYTVFENLSALYVKKAMQEKDATQQQKFKAQAIDYLKQAAEIIKTRFPQPSPHGARIQTKIKELAKALR